LSDFEAAWLRDYATRQQARPRPPTPEEVARRGATYDHYLRGWLPEERGARVLEVGCGSGWFLSALAARGYSAISGIDLSPSQVALARELGHEVHEIEAVEYLRERDAEFDLIVVLDVFEHLTRQQAWELLEYSLHALRPGGRLAIQTPNGDSPWAGNVFFGDPTHLHCYTPLLLEKLMRAAGFERVVLRPCGPVPSSFAKRLRTWAWAVVALLLSLVNRLEGADTSGIQTRNFLCSGVRSSV
jgi:2-polyprenyl-3-methyl-5-hydroxy-6-metoxy-1,4-benzoquinol methylase